MLKMLGPSGAKPGLTISLKLTFLAYLTVTFVVHPSFSFVPSSYTVHPQNNIAHNGVRSKLFSSSLDDDDSAFFADFSGPDDGSTGETPTKEKYTTEADAAQQANDLLLRTGGSQVELKTELTN